MATVHYKFKNAKNYSSVLFDGAYITVANLKKDIIKATYGPSSEVDLSIQNAQTKQGEPRATWCVASATHRLRIVMAVPASTKAQYTQPDHSLSPDTHNRVHERISNFWEVCCARPLGARPTLARVLVQIHINFPTGVGTRA